MAQFLDLEGLTTFLAKVKEWVTSQINTAKSALQSAINNKADKSHTHSNLTITLNGGTTEGTDKIVYTGGAAKTLNITASEVGAASSSHTHPISQISDLNSSWDTYLKTAPKLINGATNLTNQDLNSYSSTSNCGWYFAGGGNTVTNKPSGVASFGLEIVRTASGVVTQILYGQVGEDNELKVYYRRYYESWTSWKKIADSDDLAGKANTSHTHSAATTSAAGFMSAADKTKLDGIATGANKYVHPTTSGNKHIPAGGSSGQILRWASDGTAQWGSDNNTTYSAGTGLSLSGTTFAVKTGFTTSGKNYKVTTDSSGNLYVNVPWTDNNTTYSVFKAATASAAGGSGLVPAPAAGENDEYLRADGTWQTPPSTTYSNATTSADGLMSSEDKAKLDGIASGANKYTHPSYTSRGSGLYKITVDSTGHVSAATAVAKSDIVALGIPGSDTNTHYTTHLYAGTSTGSANATTSNGSTHLIITDDSTVRNRIKITGSGATTVSSDDEGNITINSTDTNTTYSLSGLGGIGTVNGSGSGGLNLSASKSGTTATVSGSLKLRNSTAASNSSTYTAGGSSKFYSLQIDKDGYLGTYVPWTDNNTTYSVATASKAGLVKPVSVITKPTINTASTTSGKYYHVQMSSDGNMFVNVPWTDTKTTTISWSNVTGKPSTFAPSSHSHNCSQIEDLDAISITDIEALF